MAISAWRLLRRQDILSHPRMHLVEDTVALPDGSTARYLRVAPGAAHSVAVIALNDSGQILLQKEYSYPPDEILWQLPGGGAGDDEALEAAATRELSEESGYDAQSVQVIGYYYVDNRRSDRRQYVAVCTDLTERQLQADAEEFIESFWVELNTVEEMIAAGEITNVNLLAAIKLWQARTDAAESA